MTKIILGTASPYRRAAFKNLGIDFEAEASRVDESQIERGNPEKLVSQLAKLKAKTVAKNHPDAVIIGMDSVGYFNGQILEKPKSRQEAFRRIKSLSGKPHEFYTGIYVINAANKKTAAKIIKSKIWLRKLSDSEINRYLDQDPNYNTYAIGFDPVRHISSSFAIRLVGSYNNYLIGIPLEVLPEMLKRVGYKFQ